SGGAHEAVADGETGFVVEPRDVHAVRVALTALCDDPALRDRMGHAARARAMGEYSYDRLLARLLPIARGDLSAAGTLPR
ncbi:MAG: phosphatidyl-myo-inositol dimannoside synthase, partial [Actinomycetota bacterium]|nr:phosphatidyl-myo-inositol dimannoside synthase [Actinomycetota bacterium]